MMLQARSARCIDLSTQLGALQAALHRAQEELTSRQHELSASRERLVNDEGWLEETREALRWYDQRVGALVGRLERADAERVVCEAELAGALETLAQRESELLAQRAELVVLQERLGSFQRDLVNKSGAHDEAAQAADQWMQRHREAAQTLAETRTQLAQARARLDELASRQGVAQAESAALRAELAQAKEQLIRATEQGLTGRTECARLRERAALAERRLEEADKSLAAARERAAQQEAATREERDHARDEAARLASQLGALQGRCEAMRGTVTQEIQTAAQQQGKSEALTWRSLCSFAHCARAHTSPPFFCSSRPEQLEAQRREAASKLEAANRQYAEARAQCEDLQRSLVEAERVRIPLASPSPLCFIVHFCGLLECSHGPRCVFLSCASSFALVCASARVCGADRQSCHAQVEEIRAQLAQAQQDNGQLKVAAQRQTVASDELKERVKEWSRDFVATHNRDAALLSTASATAILGAEYLLVLVAQSARAAELTAEYIRARAQASGEDVDWERTGIPEGMGGRPEAQALADAQAEAAEAAEAARAEADRPPLTEAERLEAILLGGMGMARRPGPDPAGADEEEREEEPTPGETPEQAENRVSVQVGAMTLGGGSRPGGSATLVGSGDAALDAILGAELKGPQANPSAPARLGPS
ncbi:hypothetical protein PAPYR_641 [Paratrimastix pyriformis]|uniref:Uncharacterized protein n=1 Tax=Paratrimastix pyriformis TaxID=342808 RepID=A0ABQ8UU38_9EUKA|nr:hypothetical protein PAPYR_641 [Paratrimastix pyriformis]